MGIACLREEKAFWKAGEMHTFKSPPPLPKQLMYEPFVLY